MKKTKIFYAMYVIFMIILIAFNVKNVIKLGVELAKEDRREKTKKQAIEDLEELAKESTEED